MTIKAILFDCDGTLVDTEYLCAKAFVQSIKPYGVDIEPQAMLDEFLGIANVEIAARLSKRHGVALPEKEVTAAYTEAVRAQMADLMRVMDESVAYVKGLAERGYKLAVASNGTKDVVFDELRAAGYIGAIPSNLIFTASDVRNPKPAPDMYLLAARACGVEPADCMVVEDSANGARAGIAAGMRVVGYTGFAHRPEPQTEALKNVGVTRIIKVLSDIDAHLS